MRDIRPHRSAPTRLAGGLLVLALGLAACQPQAPDGGEAQPPADAPAPLPTPPAPEAAPPVAAGPFDGEIRAVGTEPFWGLRIRDTEITLERPDFPPSMSDLTYAYQARVQSGDETLEGCAGKEGAMPREG